MSFGLILPSLIFIISLLFYFYLCLSLVSFVYVLQEPVRQEEVVAETPIETIPKVEIKEVWFYPLTIMLCVLSHHQVFVLHII